MRLDIIKFGVVV